MDIASIHGHSYGHYILACYMITFYNLHFLMIESTAYDFCFVVYQTHLALAIDAIYHQLSRPSRLIRAKSKGKKPGV